MSKIIDIVGLGAVTKVSVEKSPNNDDQGQDQENSGKMGKTMESSIEKSRIKNLDIKIQRDSKTSGNSRNQRNVSDLPETFMNDSSSDKKSNKFGETADDFEQPLAGHERSSYTFENSNILLRSALDDGDENRSDETEYTENTDSTYDEGTYIQSLGTIEDTLDMNPEDAVAYAIEAYKRIDGPPMAPFRNGRVSTNSVECIFRDSGESPSKMNTSTSGSQQQSAEQGNSRYNIERDNTLLRSALDDDEGSSEDTEYTESDDNTYDEGTYIHSLGTFEDTMADMKAEEAIAYAMAAAKRAEEQVEADANTIAGEIALDTNDFDRQIADFHDRQAAAVETHYTQQPTHDMDSVDEFSSTH